MVGTMKKTLLETNRYLQDNILRDKSFSINIETSSAIEGIHVSRDSLTGRFVLLPDTVITTAQRTTTP
jgi:hypothetical protein